MKRNCCHKEHHLVTADPPKNLHLKQHTVPLCRIIKREDSCIRGKIEEQYCETCGEVLAREIVR